jgi:ATP-dependent helicase HepA
MNHITEFATGQRWLSDTEPDLGLGLVSNTDQRSVTLEFTAIGESRRYAKDDAPLSRLILKPGDTFKLGNVEVEVLKVIPASIGTVIYSIKIPGSEPLPLPEASLPGTLSMNRPLDRLLTGQFDTCQWFYLKQQSLQLLGKAEASGVMGLCSARVDLIPHQLYIAEEVARRYAPRVMLADEVGLGKTIEAGLIVQQQLISGLSNRVLIVVPEALLHQWLVEMLRRFNLQFTVLDKARCDALTQSGEVNPFASAQLVLCPLSLFISDPTRIEKAEAATWDLCIVDEAHHIELGERLLHDPDQASDTLDTAYQALSRLAAATKGLLLLTATPEQLGQKNHFALLHLIDPARFDDYPGFVAEQVQYRDIAEQIRNLADTPENSDSIQNLLDQHGTGRILFRNTRRVLSGFPERQLQPWPLLPLPAHERGDGEGGPDDDALDEDPRVRWLSQWLRESAQKPEERKQKILLICAQDTLAIALEKHLRLKVGVRSSVFHRHMSLLERDRAAAYFASEENAARILVCSEIGSEGRNFQFCRHLVLFDLPLNPELLEQRIGRLDRIGQNYNVQIHVPYVTGSSQEILFLWYHRALNAFEHVAPAAYRLYQELRGQLQQHLSHPDPDSAAFRGFLSKTADRNQMLQQMLEEGRDQLLERNSFNALHAADLLARIAAFESECTPEPWLRNVLDSYAVFFDDNSDGSINIVPSEDMLLPVFPGLPEEGFEACFQRQQALIREDRAFLSWQHPMVTGAMDLVLETHQGKAAVSKFKSVASAEVEWPAPTAPLLLEFLFRLKVSAPAHLQLAKYLPAGSIELCMTLDPNDEIKVIKHTLAEHRNCLQVPNKAVALEQLQTHQKLLMALSVKASELAAMQCKQTAGQAVKTMLASQTAEIKRMLALKQRNPNIRQEEIDYLKEQTLALHQCLSRAEAELIAVHVILRG